MRRILLCILDGWGERTLDQNNALSKAFYWQHLKETYPHTFLQASESYVGLPDGQMGNSEVGHMTIGLGRLMMQDLPRIHKAIEANGFSHSAEFQAFVKQIKKSTNRCHVMGLFSPGGVHSHEDHFIYVSKLLAKEGVDVIVHPILDGRDTAPSSAQHSLDKLESILNNSITAGTLSGRFYAMDRDNRWERTEKAYCAVMQAKGDRYSTFSAALKVSYLQGKTDEFVEPVVISDFTGVNPEDSLFFINFRGDRARQIMSSFVLPDFSAFSTLNIPFSAVLTMADYSSELSNHHKTLFKKIPVSDGLSEVLSKHSLLQLHIAETEKYAHVTYFFNGGKEDPFDGEDRILIPSPKVATYDLQPEMSAALVTEHVCAALLEKKYHFIVVNYANPDMVGHTGISDAIDKAISTIDQTLEQLEKTALDNDWLLIVTADHGNVEQYVDENMQPHTAHTCNPVPFLVVNGEKHLAFNKNGTLADIAPTILHWMCLPIPETMSGKILPQL